MPCEEGKSKSPCPKELEGLNALEACKLVEEKKKGIMDVLGDLHPVAAIGNIFGSKNKSVSNFCTETQITVDQTQLSEALALCDAQVKMVQSNVVDTTACDALEKEQERRLWEYLKDARARGDTEGAAFIQQAILNLEKSDESTIDQSNDAELTIKCKANAVLAALAKADATVANVAMMDLLQKASGPMTSNSANTNVCNKTSIHQSACQYVSNKSCCMTNFESSQSNVMLGCAKSGKQSNRFIANIACDAGSTTDVRAETTTKGESNTGITSNQSADMNMSMSSASTTCCVCLCLLVGLAIALLYFTSEGDGSTPSGDGIVGGPPVLKGIPVNRLSGLASKFPGKR